MPRPSAVRVFAKSLHILAVAWVASVAVLWGAEIRQDTRLDPTAPRDPHIPTILEGVLPAFLIEASAREVDRRIGAASSGVDQRREWVHAVWWSILPVALLIATVYLTLWPG